MRSKPHSHLRLADKFNVKLLSATLSKYPTTRAATPFLITYISKIIVHIAVTSNWDLGKTIGLGSAMDGCWVGGVGEVTGQEKSGGWGGWRLG